MILELAHRPYASAVLLVDFDPLDIGEKDINDSECRWPKNTDTQPPVEPTPIGVLQPGPLS